MRWLALVYNHQSNTHAPNTISWVSPNRAHRTAGLDRVPYRTIVRRQFTECSGGLLLFRYTSPSKRTTSKRFRLRGGAQLHPSVLGLVRFCTYLHKNVLSRSSYNMSDFGVLRRKRKKFSDTRVRDIAAAFDLS